jgi:hypothetical protein
VEKKRSRRGRSSRDAQFDDEEAGEGDELA